MNKNIIFLFTVKNISCIQFSLCHTSDKKFLTSNFSLTTVVTLITACCKLGSHGLCAHLLLCFCSVEYGLVLMYVHTFNNLCC